jgi:hypothetical protein
VFSSDDGRDEKSGYSDHVIHLTNNPTLTEEHIMRKVLLYGIGGMVLVLLLTPVAELNTAAAQSHNITFQVNMSIKMREEAFDPALDTVWVRGNFNSWGGNDFMSDGDSDSIYTVTVSTTEASLVYKF